MKVSSAEALLCSVFKKRAPSKTVHCDYHQDFAKYTANWGLHLH